MEVLRYIEYAFTKAVAKFPKYTELRIYQVIYLLEVKKRPFEALVVLEKIPEKNITEQYFFVVSCLMKSLNEVKVDQNILEMISAGTIIDMNKVPFQHLLKKFQAIIERTTVLYSEIWTHLQEES